jgi:hypothetical protein
MSIHQINPIIEPFLDDRDIVYAAKHALEAKFKFTGFVTLEHYRNQELIHKESGFNTFTTEGMAYMLNVMFKDTARPSAQYIGLFKNNVTPANANTAAVHLGAAGTYGECQDADYTPATNRPLYTAATTTTASITNVASKAEFTIAQDISPGIYGAFITTTQAKTDTTGKLMCAKKFAAVRGVLTADVLAITYVISCTSS